MAGWGIFRQNRSFSRLVSISILYCTVSKLRNFEKISLFGNLSFFSSAKLHSFDLDPDALLASKGIHYKNFNFIHDNFRNLENYFDDESISGAIIDCGLSSPQLDSPERGFSFQKKRTIRYEIQ